MSLLIKTLISLDHGLMLMTSLNLLNLNYFLRGLTPNTATLGLKAFTYEILGGYKSVYNTE